MRIESIQVGKPSKIDSNWTSAIFKQPVSGAIWLGQYNLDGDQQADLSVHGGEDKAVNVYPLEHYHYWRQRGYFSLRRRVQLPTPCNGAFGENFTLTGLLESQVCIGDIYALDDVLVQVSQPRQPCWKLARKFNQAKLPFWIQKTGKTGWYLRVLKEGYVQRLSDLKLIERPHPAWSIQRANQLKYSRHQDKDAIQSLLACKALSASWRKTFDK